MARKRKSRARWAKILDWDFEDFYPLSIEELRLNLRSVAREASRRQTQLNKRGLEIFSEAVRALETGGKRGKGRITYSKSIDTRQSIIREIRRGIGFLNAKTSTVSGAEERRAWFQERFPGVTGEDVSRFWELYDSVYGPGSKIAGFANALGSTRVQRTIYEAMRDGAEPGTREYVEAFRRAYEKTR